MTLDVSPDLTKKTGTASQHDRILCFGDSITWGYLDQTGLGWPGRLGLHLKSRGYSAITFNMGINGDTSRDIAQRWQAEADARSRNAVGLFVFAFGFNDAACLDGGDEQVSIEVSCALARNILTNASVRSPVLWVGPTPLDETVNPLRTRNNLWEMSNQRLAQYDEAYAKLAQDLGVSYLRLFPDFIASDRYRAALRDGDKVHPGQDGYAMIAERICAWPRWEDLIV